MVAWFKFVFYVPSRCGSSQFPLYEDLTIFNFSAHACLSSLIVWTLSNSSFLAWTTLSRWTLDNSMAETISGMTTERRLWFSASLLTMLCLAIHAVIEQRSSQAPRDRILLYSQICDLELSVACLPSVLSYEAWVLCSYTQVLNTQLYQVGVFCKRACEWYHMSFEIDKAKSEAKGVREDLWDMHVDIIWYPHLRYSPTAETRAFGMETI